MRTVLCLALCALTTPALSQGLLKTHLESGVLLGQPTTLPLPNARTLTLTGVGVMRYQEPEGFTTRLARVGAGLTLSRRSRLLAEVQLGDRVEVTRLQGSVAMGKSWSATLGQLAVPFGIALSQSPALWPTPERPLAFREDGPGPLARQEFDRGLQLQHRAGGSTLTLAAINGAGRSAETDSRRDVVLRAAQTIGKFTAGASAYRGEKSLTGLDLQREGAGLQLQAELLEGRGVHGGYITGGYLFDANSPHPWSVLTQFDRLGAQRSVSAGISYNLEAGLRARLFSTRPKNSGTRWTADLLFAL